MHPRLLSNGQDFYFYGFNFNVPIQNYQRVPIKDIKNQLHNTSFISSNVYNPGIVVFSVFDQKLLKTDGPTYVPGGVRFVFCL